MIEGQFDRAETLLENTVTTRVLYYGDDHQLTLCAKRNLQYVKNKRQSLAQRPLTADPTVAQLSNKVNSNVTVGERND